MLQMWDMLINKIEITVKAKKQSLEASNLTFEVRRSDKVNTGDSRGRAEREEARQLRARDGGGGS